MPAPFRETERIHKALFPADPSELRWKFRTISDAFLSYDFVQVREAIFLILLHGKDIIKDELLVLRNILLPRYPRALPDRCYAERTFSFRYGSGHHMG